MKATELFSGELIEANNAAMWPFRSQIADREQVLVALALARQKKVAAANARIRRGFLDGIGEVVASIDADLYHRLGLMYGYETVNSDDFLRCLLRDNPEIRVRTESRRCGVFLSEHYRADGGASKQSERVNSKQSEGAASADVCTEGAALEAGEMERGDQAVASPAEVAA